MEGYLAQLRYREDSLGPALSDITDFVDSPNPSEEWMESEVGERWGKWKEEKERELRLVRKIKEKIF